MRRGWMILLLILVLLLTLASMALADGRPYVPPYHQPMQTGVSF